MLYTSLQLKYRENCLASRITYQPRETICIGRLPINVAQVLRESVKQVKPVESKTHVLVLRNVQPKVASGRQTDSMSWKIKTR